MMVWSSERSFDHSFRVAFLVGMVNAQAVFGDFARL
jgi:hypothetical protein